VVAFPSRPVGLREEGAPVALTEARLAGIPVIGSAGGGLVERIRDGVDGRLVAGEADEWRRTLHQLRDDPELRRRLGEAGRAADRWLAWPALIERAERALQG